MLTNRQAVTILNEIKLGGIFATMRPSFQILGCGDPETGTCRVILTLHVPDRDSGADFEAVFNRQYPAPMTRDDVIALARAITHHAVIHEADESLRVGGVLPFDPHRRA